MKSKTVVMESFLLSWLNMTFPWMGPKVETVFILCSWKKKNPMLYKQWGILQSTISMDDFTQIHYTILLK